MRGRRNLASITAGAIRREQSKQKRYNAQSSNNTENTHPGISILAIILAIIVIVPIIMLFAYMVSNFGITGLLIALFIVGVIWAFFF